MIPTGECILLERNGGIEEKLRRYLEVSGTRVAKFGMPFQEHNQVISPRCRSMSEWRFFGQNVGISAF
jgi:hypothetical protein